MPLQLPIGIRAEDAHQLRTRVAQRRRETMAAGRLAVSPTVFDFSEFERLKPLRFFRIPSSYTAAFFDHVGRRSEHVSGTKKCQCRDVARDDS
jgi:hypothetical protein